MQIDMINSAIDLIEGAVVGGLIGFGTSIISTAVSNLPGSFLSVGNAPFFSVIAGALGFVGYALPNIRKRIKPDVVNAN